MDIVEASVCSYKFTETDKRGKLKVITCHKPATCPICNQCCSDQLDPGSGDHCPGHRGVLPHLLLPRPKARAE